MRRLFAAVRAEFDSGADAEVTLECAPGQLSDETLDAMLGGGVNRVSFGVQSFVDSEAAAVGRLHTREICLAEIDADAGGGRRESQCGPDRWVCRGQTAAELARVGGDCDRSGVPHVSVYMLEVDEDSRLGREVSDRREQREHEQVEVRRGAVPSEDAIAEWYGAACEWLESAGMRQYEISNFARAGSSRGTT